MVGIVGVMLIRLIDVIVELHLLDMLTKPVKAGRKCKGVKTGSWKVTKSGNGECGNGEWGT